MNGSVKANGLENIPMQPKQPPAFKGHEATKRMSKYKYHVLIIIIITRENKMYQINVSSAGSQAHSGV